VPEPRRGSAADRGPDVHDDLDHRPDAQVLVLIDRG
jgi:hypothetical protein